MTTVDEVSDKTKVADEFILRSVLLFFFTIDVSLHVKLLIKVIRLHTCVLTNIWVTVFMC